MAKDSPKITGGELQKIVESWGQKKHKKSNSPYITTCCPDSSIYSVVRHDWNFKWHWFLWSVETKKLAFWQQIHQMGLKQKKYLMPSQSSDLNPVENEWGEPKRRSTNMEQ